MRRGWLVAGVVAASLVSVETGVLVSQSGEQQQTVTPAADVTRSASASPIPAVRPSRTHHVKPAPVYRQPAPVRTHRVYRQHVTPRTSAPHGNAPKTSAPARHFVTPGAFCSPEGAHGVTSTGKAMTCKPSTTDSRARWRS